jgi:hypothetical protein
MKGQSTIEFLGTSLMFIALLGTILVVASDTIPLFDDEVEEAEINAELHDMTNSLLTSPGRTDTSPNWEQNADNTQVLGLSESVGEVERSKVGALDDDSSSDSIINYTEFRELTGVKNQYRFIFTWYPIVETHKTFTRSNPPDKILEPTLTEYSDDGNTVHYGTAMINGRNMKFLVTSHDQVYDTVYISNTWSFRGSQPHVRGEVVDIQGQQFTVQQFQNRESDPGNLVIFSSQIKDFGAPQAQSSTVVKLNRYAVLKDIESGDFPVKIEVLAW